MIHSKLDPTTPLNPIHFDPSIIDKKLSLNSNNASAFISSSKSIHFPVKYPIMADIKSANTKAVFKRAAHEMTVEKEDESVHSYDYHINPFIGDKRERKFREQTTSSKEDPQIKTLIEKKKCLKNELATNVSNNQKKHMIELLDFYAKKGVDFKALPSYFDQNTASNELKAAYHKLINFKKIDIPSEFGELIDFNSMTYSEIFCELGYDQKIHTGIKILKVNVLEFYESLNEDSINQTNLSYKQANSKAKKQLAEKIKRQTEYPLTFTAENWISIKENLETILNSEHIKNLEKETNPLIIRKLISEFKLDMYQFNSKLSVDNSIIIKLNKNIDNLNTQIFAALDKVTEVEWDTKKSIIEVLEKYWNTETPKLSNKKILTDMSIREFFVSLGFDIPVLPPLLFNSLPNWITGDQNKRLIGQMIIAITNRLRQKIPTSETINRVFSDFQISCENEWLPYFELLSQKIKKDSIISLDHIIKEQRQHSLVRFNNLFNYYTAFVNTVHILGNMGQVKYGDDFKKKAHTVVADLLENAYIELKEHTKLNKKSEKIQPKTADIQELEKLVTIDLDYHRIKSIMGYEQTKMDKEKKKEIINTLNVLLGIDEKNKLIFELQRSHSLQFPSVFAWKKSKLVKCINIEFETNLDENFESVDTFFSRDFFKSMKDEIMPHSNIEDLFSKEFDKILNAFDSKEKFLFMSLDLMRKFYIRLFSETELFPDLINKYADGASEWRGKGTKGETYKKSLSGILRSLVMNKKEYKKAETLNALKPYLERTASELDRLNKKLETNSANSLFKKICFFQVEESMRIAMNGIVEPNFIEDIFNTALKSNPIYSVLNTANMILV